MPVGRIIFVVSIGLMAASVAANEAAKPSLEKRAAFFENHIRPLLVERCFECHDEDTQESGLRLDSLQAMLDGGERGPAIVIGDAKASVLIHAVNHSGVELQMPEGDKLSARQIKLLTRWVDDGAIWPGAEPRTSTSQSAQHGPLFTPEQKNFWAFQSPKSTAPPDVFQEAWPQSDLDRFILKRLEDASLLPAPPASKRSLIRRAYFDLTGLPPTPAAVKEFLADESPQAFENVIDKLLASPRYGERWGRHWLDVARYADSNGLDENVAFEYIYKYRDWVIDAINRDLPYDKFVQQQIAGDLIQQESDETEDDYIHRVKAVGFLAVGPKMIADDDPEKKKMDMIDEQLNTVSQAFMAMTVGCARCHDHKFDPIPTWDYYAMASIFKSTQTLGNLGVVAPIVRLELKPHGYDAALAAYESAHEKLEQDRNAVLDVASRPHLNIARSRIADYVAAVAHYGLFEMPDATRDIVWQAEDTAATPLETKSLGSATVITERSYPVYQIDIPTGGKYALLLRMANNDKRPQKLWLDGDKLKQRGGFVATGGQDEMHLRWLRHAIVDLTAGEHEIKIERINGVVDSLALVRVEDDASEVQSPADLAKRRGLEAALLVQWIDYVAQALSDAESPWASLFGVPASNFDPRLTDILANESIATAIAGPTGPLRVPHDADKWIDDSQRAAWIALNKAKSELEKEQPQLEYIMGVKESEPEDLRVSLRGNYLTLGEQTRRQFLRIIDGETPTPIDTKQSGRLELATWLTKPEHPLTARVIVNRVWRWRFGRGIVATTDNFGRLGARPTHPELLDWLATTFVEEDGWSLKRLHKRMMLSSTYQMSTTFDEFSNDLDPTNSLWWRFPRRRLEAEAVRDAVLSVSDRIDFEVGGSLMPLKDKAYVTGTASTVHNYENPRRSVYQPVYRSAVYDVLTAFDFPDPATLNGDRANSIVAPQALLMMNSPLVEKSANRLAQQLRDSPGDVPGRLETLYWKILSRPPQPQEVAAISTFLHAAEDSQLDPWVSVCRAVLASNEFLYLD